MLNYPADKDGNYTKETELIMSIMRLAGDRDFQKFVIWMEESLWNYRQMGDTLVDGPVPMKSWNQGSCQCLSEILNTIAQSPETLKKLQAGASKQTQHRNQMKEGNQ